MSSQASNFDDWYAKLLTPAGTVPHGLTPVLAESMVRLSYDTGVRQIVKKMGANNDVASLKVYLDAFIKEGLNQETKEERFDPGLTYAVTHLLVDGSGNEAFAKRWLETMGHTSEKADMWFRDKTSLLLSAADDVVHSQQRLGLATLVEDLFSMRFNQENGYAKYSPFDEAFSGVLPSKDLLSRDFLPELRYSAAVIFRYLHPDGLPQATVFSYGNQADQVPLLNTLWRNDDLQHVLGAVHLAYGSNHEVVRDQMVKSIEGVFDEGAIRFWDPTRPDDSDRWDAVVGWMGQDILKIVINGNVLSGLKYKGEHMTFFDSLMRIPLEKSIERLADLQEKGFNLDDFNTEEGTDSKTPVRRNLLICAIGNARHDMVAWLLAQGCDPELPSGLPNSLSPYEFAIDLEANFKNWHAKGEITYGEIADLMRTAKSKSEALKAINELDDRGQVSRP